MKGKEYLKLNQLKRGFSEEKVEELLIENNNIRLETILLSTNEEYHDIVTKWYNHYKIEMENILNLVVNEIIEISKLNFTNKEIGLIIKQENNQNNVKMSEITKKMIFISKKLIDNKKLSRDQIAQILWSDKRWRNSLWNNARKLGLRRTYRSCQVVK